MGRAKARLRKEKRMSEDRMDEIFRSMFDDDAKEKLQMYDGLIESANAIKALFDSLVDSGFTEEQSMNLLNTILRVALSQGKE